MKFTREDWELRITPYITIEKDCWLWARSRRLKIGVEGKKRSLRELALLAFRGEQIETTTRMSCKNTRCCNPKHILNSEEERFWSYVIKYDETCWRWTGPTVRGGYGSFGRKTKQAHRYSYEIHKGPIPEGLVVRHMCHTPSCVNPSHLCTGTHLENSKDMFLAKRERPAVGKANGMSKLTGEQVIQIRKLANTGQYSNADLGRLFAVTRQNIRSIVTYSTWRHL